MSKRKYTLKAECPQCAFGNFSFLEPKNLREKFIGNKEEIDILCPVCETVYKGKLHEEHEEED